MRSVRARSGRLVHVEDWPFAAIWATWTAISTFSLMAAVFMATLVVAALSLNEDRAMAPILLLLWFVMMAAGQTWMLSARLRRAGWWPVVSAVGWLSLVPVVWLISLWPGDAMNTLTTGTTLMIVGATTGIAQWLVLRGQWDRAGWWPAASALSGGALALAIGPTITSMAEFVWIGAIPGATMGLLVAWMFVDLRRPA